MQCESDRFKVTLTLSFTISTCQIIKSWSNFRAIYSGDPVSDGLTKRTIPEYGPPFFSPKYFPIHIMYYQIQKADRPRFTDLPFSVPNHKRTRKTDQQKKKSPFYSYIYASIKESAAAGFTNGTSCSWIH